MSLPDKLEAEVEKHKKDVFSDGYQKNFQDWFARCLSEGLLFHTFKEGQEEFLNSCSIDQLDRLIEVIVDGRVTTVSHYYVLSKLENSAKLINIKDVNFYIRNNDADDELNKLKQDFLNAAPLICEGLPSGSIALGKRDRNEIAVAKAAGKILRNSNIAGGLTVAGAAVLLSTLGALSPSMTSLIAANPLAGGCVLALIVLVGAVMVATGAVHAHAARVGKSVKELFAGSDKGKSSQPIIL